MGKKAGKRSIASMKYHLYKKVLYRETFPSFSVMFNAGIESILPVPLENIKVPKGLNTNYGIAYASIISTLLSALNNLAISVFNPNFNSLSNLQLGESSFFGQASGLQFIQQYSQLYDNYSQLCKILYQPAIFDETYFDLSVYQPAHTIENRNEACKKLEQYFDGITTTNISINLQNLGVGNTQIPNVDNY